MQYDIPTKRGQKTRSQTPEVFYLYKTHIHFVPKLTNVVTYDIVSRGHSVICTARMLLS